MLFYAFAKLRLNGYANPDAAGGLCLTGTLPLSPAALPVSAQNQMEPYPF